MYCGLVVSIKAHGAQVTAVGLNSAHTVSLVFKSMFKKNNLELNRIFKIIINNKINMK